MAQAVAGHRTYSGVEIQTPKTTAIKGIVEAPAVNAVRMAAMHGPSPSLSRMSDPREMPVYLSDLDELRDPGWRPYSQR